jgi:hypothetical protein
MTIGSVLDSVLDSHPLQPISASAINNLMFITFIWNNVVIKISALIHMKYGEYGDSDITDAWFEHVNGWANANEAKLKNQLLMHVYPNRQRYLDLSKEEKDKFEGEFDQFLTLAMDDFAKNYNVNDERLQSLDNYLVNDPSVNKYKQAKEFFIKEVPWSVISNYYLLNVGFLWDSYKEHNRKLAGINKIARRIANI